MQRESAARHPANAYACDPGEAGEGGTITLRRGVEEVSVTLWRELQERFDKAGVQVDPARWTPLAYGPEIAGGMLWRQQAEAVISAR